MSLLPQMFLLRCQIAPLVQVFQAGVKHSTTNGCPGEKSEFIISSSLSKSSKPSYDKVLQDYSQFCAQKFKVHKFIPLNIRNVILFVSSSHQRLLIIHDCFYVIITELFPKVVWLPGLFLTLFSIKNLYQA